MSPIRGEGEQSVLDWTIGPRRSLVSKSARLLSEIAEFESAALREGDLGSGELVEMRRRRGLHAA